MIINNYPVLSLVHSYLVDISLLRIATFVWLVLIGYVFIPITITHMDTLILWTMMYLVLSAFSTTVSYYLYGKSNSVYYFWLVFWALVTKGIMLFIVAPLIIACMSSTRHLSTSSNLSNHNGNKFMVGSFNDKGTLLQLTKLQVLERFNTRCAELLAIELSSPASEATRLEFQQLFNGVFQAEGTWTGSFKSLTSMQYRPVCAVRQNAGTDSVEFFAKLCAYLPNVFKLDLTVNAYGNWSFSLRVTSWDTILNVVVPYLQYLQGDKFTAMSKLAALRKLQYSTTFEDTLHAVWLAYHLTLLGVSRQVTLGEKMKALFPDKDKYIIPNFNHLYPTTTTPISLLFVIGFFLGDGNMYVHLRDEKSYVSFVPQFKISQALTAANHKLIIDIGAFLNSLGVVTQVGVLGEVCHVKVVGVSNIVPLLSLIGPYSHLLYWKEGQYLMLTKLTDLMELKIKGWLELWLAMLDCVYELENKRTFDYGYWEKRLTDVYNHMTSGLLAGASFVTTENYKVGPHKGEFKCWLVKFPPVLDIKPRVKSFYPNTYGGRAEALTAAMEYRNTILAEQLSNLTSNTPHSK